MRAGRKKRRDIIAQAEHTTGMSYIRIIRYACDWSGETIPESKVNEYIIMYGNGGRMPKFIKDYAREMIEAQNRKEGK